MKLRVGIDVIAPADMICCTGLFTTAAGLPCSRKIQERFYKGSAFLEDFHPTLKMNSHIY